MNAALQNTGRSIVREREEAMIERERQLPRARITVRNCDARSDEERQADNQARAAKLGVSRMCFI